MDMMATEETEAVQPFAIPVCKLQEGDDHGPWARQWNDLPS